MRIAVLCLALAVAAPAFPQEKRDPKPPKKGDTIVVRGCLRGSALESTEARRLDETGMAPMALTFRLTGKKDLLKALRGEHDRRVVEVTGILKSTLPDTDEGTGRRIGKARVVIGVGPPSSPMEAETNRSIPALEVRSFEGTSVTCGG